MFMGKENKMVKVWYAVDENDEEFVYDGLPFREANFWDNNVYRWVLLPKGTIEKILGKKITWSDEPVEVEGE